MIFLFRFILGKNSIQHSTVFRTPSPFPLESSFVTGLLDKKSFSREEVKKKKKKKESRENTRKGKKE
jgi:hypothetical protein